MTQAPTGITATSRGGGWHTVSWDPVPGADYYESWHEGEGHPTQLATPTSALLAIAAGTRRFTRVRNVVGNLASTWVTVTLDAHGVIVDLDGEPAPDPTPPKPPPKPDPVPPKPDPTPPAAAPGRPRNVRAHCITHQSTKVEWDRDPVVHEYEVWIDGSPDEAQRTADTLVSVTGLKPTTRYTAKVVAHNPHGSSEPGEIVFTTGRDEPAPEPDPDVDVAAEWPAPALVVWPLEGGKVRATWTDPDDGRKPKKEMGYPFWHVSLDGTTWYFTRDRQYEFEVLPGAEVMVSVYGVWDNTLTAIATKGVAL